jgi:hypothetical protein
MLSLFFILLSILSVLLPVFLFPISLLLEVFLFPTSILFAAFWLISHYITKIKENHITSWSFF